jgi:hypothetical protein
VKVALALVVLLGSVTSARADVFAFKDLDGFEKCMQLDHLIEKIATDKGSQTRVLGSAEIQLRCIESAVKLLTGSKNKDVMMDFVKSTRRLSAPENALDIISVLADSAVTACNDIEVYEVLNRGLAHSKGDDFYVKKARIGVKKCLKDKDYRKDFLEEKDNANADLAANACQILLEEKLVKACKGAK